MSGDAAGTSACATLCPRGVDLLGIHAQFGEGGDRLLGVEPALARQARKRGGRDGFGVDLDRKSTRLNSSHLVISPSSPPGPFPILPPQFGEGGGPLLGRQPAPPAQGGKARGPGGFGR